MISFTFGLIDAATVAALHNVDGAGWGENGGDEGFFGQVGAGRRDAVHAG